MLFSQLHYFEIAQDIYYIKQTPRYTIFAATLFWNSTGHLLHKTNPDLSYFEISYVFWEHNDSVGRGTTALDYRRKNKIQSRSLRNSTTPENVISELQRRQPHRGRRRPHRRALAHRRHQLGAAAAAAAELTLCGEGGLKVVVCAPLEFRARASTRSGYVLVVVGKIDEQRGYTLLFVGKTILNTYNLIPSLENNAEESKFQDWGRRKSVGIYFIWSD